MTKIIKLSLTLGILAAVSLPIQASGQSETSRAHCQMCNMACPTTVVEEESSQGNSENNGVETNRPPVWELRRD